MDYMFWIDANNRNRRNLDLWIDGFQLVDLIGNKFHFSLDDRHAKNEPYWLYWMRFLWFGVQDSLSLEVEPKRKIQILKKFP